MDFSVKTIQKFSDVTDKWVLAERLSGHVNIHEQCLKSVFQGVMKGLEEQFKMTFDSKLQERIWVAVSKERLEIVRTEFFSIFCVKILGGFSKKEVEEMLEEHKKTKFIRNPIYSGSLQTAHHMNQEIIVDTVSKKASSLAEAWVQEIVEACEKEGIKFNENNEKK